MAIYVEGFENNNNGFDALLRKAINHPESPPKALLFGRENRFSRANPGFISPLLFSKVLKLVIIFCNLIDDVEIVLCMRE